MEILDIIKQLCKERNISIAQLEQALDYGNGSIAKSKGNMSADRLFKIAQYFNVSMEYLMTGKTVNDTNDEMAIMMQQQAILMKISKIGQDMTEYYKKIAECQDQLTELKKEYSKLESKKAPQPKDNQQLPQPLPMPGEFIDFLDGFGDDLPFN